MRMFMTRGLFAVAGLLVVGGASSVVAQTPPVAAPTTQAPSTATSDTATFCGQRVPPPASLPPVGSGPVVYLVGPCFAAQGNTSIVEPQTYLYYMQITSKLSQPSQNRWVPYDESVEEIVRGDFQRLWATNFLTDLSIVVSDYTFSNGVIGKLIAYNMEERERVKIVNYEGTKEIDRAKIDEQLRLRNIELRLDSFLDQDLIRRVETVLREMMAEKGFTNAEVSHTRTAVAGGPKLVNVTFQIGDGPKLKIRNIEFIGNSAKTDRALRRKMKDNKTPDPFWGWITRGGTYKADKFEADADLVLAYYRNEGHVRAQVGQPEIRTLQDSGDKKTRWIQLRIPVTEGPAVPGGRARRRREQGRQDRSPDAPLRCQGG